MMKPLSLVVYLVATTLAIQSGCQAQSKGPVSGSQIDAASADARIYVSGVG